MILQGTHQRAAQGLQHARSADEQDIQQRDAAAQQMVRHETAAMRHEHAIGHAEAAKEPQPDLHIRGDREVRYERVAVAMASAQRAGLRKIGFVTDPQQ